MPYIIFGLLAYLLGSVPNGFLIAKTRGVDIRTVGSGNIGATNVFREVGKGWGILTFAGDVLKGFLPALVFPLLAERTMAYAGGSGNGLAIACGVLAIVGHNWSIFLGFKGGKGVATSAGALLGFAPAAAGIGLLAWAALLFASRYVSVSSMATAIIVPAVAVALYRGDPDWARRGTLIVLGILVVWRHRSNIQRLKDGTENRLPKWGTKGR